MNKYFSPKDLEDIKNEVRAAELKTSGEIVPVVLPMSAHYSWVASSTALIGLMLATLMAILLRFLHPFFWEGESLIFLQSMGGVLGYLVGKFSGIIRIVVGKDRMAIEVHKTAMAEFMRFGLHETKERTGVLIFISLLERRAEIIGDKGIHSIVGEAFWKNELDRLVAGMRSHQSSKALIDVIKSVGTRLQENFPRSESDKNEIPDHLRT